MVPRLGKLVSNINPQHLLKQVADSRFAKAKPLNKGAQAIEKLDVMVRQAPQQAHEAYLLNVDGTVLTGGKLMDGMKPVLETIKLLRRPVRFITGSSTVSRQQIADELRRNGVEVELEQIFTPTRVTIAYLKKNYPGAKVYPIANAEVCAALEAGGIELSTNPLDTRVVLVAHDRDFTYAKLKDAYDAILSNGAVLISSSVRREHLLPDGSYEPGTLSIIAAIEKATRTNLTKNLGSPETDMLEMIYSGLSANPAKSLLVTDSLAGDVRMAKSFGVPTALILTGESTYEQARSLRSKDQPNYVLDSVVDIVPPYIVNQL
ncbi:MAG: HAD hydrolase-like protein [Trueperella sp.]|nr:HAD hydrolase-like protein [Trueperella sp.]